MSGREAIVRKILADAEEQSAERIRAASERASARVEERKKAAETERTEMLARAREEAAETVARRVTVAELDGRKERLQCKRRILDRVLRAALSEACSADREQTRRLVQSLLAEHAEEGDEILLPEDSPLTEEDVRGMQAFAEKNLRFGGRSPALAGGCKLVNAVCEKDLTLGAKLAQMRDELEAELAGRLFGNEGP